MPHPPDGTHMQLRGEEERFTHLSPTAEAGRQLLSWEKEAEQRGA